MTPNGPNAGPKVGPVVISEIMYHPPDWPDGEDNQDDEFIELRNSPPERGAPLRSGPARPTPGAWRVRVDFTLPHQRDPARRAAPAAGEFRSRRHEAAKLAAFRSRYGVADERADLRPLPGKLDNSAEAIKL